MIFTESSLLTDTAEYVVKKHITSLCIQQNFAAAKNALGNFGTKFL
jgi:hypothetical protein